MTNTCAGKGENPDLFRLFDSPSTDRLDHALPSLGHIFWLISLWANKHSWVDWPNCMVLHCDGFSSSLHLLAQPSQWLEKTVAITSLGRISTVGEVCIEINSKFEQWTFLWWKSVQCIKIDKFNVSNQFIIFNLSLSAFTYSIINIV